MYREPQNSESARRHRGSSASGRASSASRRVGCPIDTERERLANHARTLAGYEPESSALDPLIVGRLLDRITQALNLVAGPIVIHDKAGLLPRDALGGFLVYDYPVIEQPDTCSGRNCANAPDAVRAHAEFLRQTEPPILLKMHQWLAGQNAGALFELWDEKLAGLALAPETSTLAEAARQKLHEVRHTVDRRQ